MLKLLGLKNKVIYLVIKNYARAKQNTIIDIEKKEIKKETVEIVSRARSKSHAHR